MIVTAESGRHVQFGKEGGFTLYPPSCGVTSAFTAAERLSETGRPHVQPEWRRAYACVLRDGLMRGIDRDIPD